MYMPSMKERLEALEARRDELDRVLAASPRQAPVHLHPRLGEIHRDKVANLQASLNVEGIQTEAAEILSGLIDRIVLSPTENDIRAELHGDLAEILALCNDGDDKIQRPGSDDPGRQLWMVAGLYRNWWQGQFSVVSSSRASGQNLDEDCCAQSPHPRYIACLWPSAA